MSDYLLTVTPTSLLQRQERALTAYKHALVLAAKRCSNVMLDTVRVTLVRAINTYINKGYNQEYGHLRLQVTESAFILTLGDTTINFDAYMYEISETGWVKPSSLGLMGDTPEELLTHTLLVNIPELILLQYYSHQFLFARYEADSKTRLDVSKVEVSLCDINVDAIPD